MSRINKHVVGQGHQLGMEAVVEHAGQLLRRMSAREVRTSNITKEQSISGQNGPGRARLVVIGDNEADAFERVTGRFPNFELTVAEVQLEAVCDRHVRELCASLRSDVNFCSGARREL